MYIRIAQENSWTIRYVMDTHIHADYLSRTRALSAHSGAKHIFIEEAVANVAYPFIPVEDQQVLPFGNEEVKKAITEV